MESQIPAISGFDADDLRALQLFYPFAFEQTMRGIQQQIRFAHYSSAESAMKILQNNQVWMRRVGAGLAVLKRNRWAGPLRLTQRRR